MSQNRPQNRQRILLALMLGGALLDQGSKWLAKTQLDPIHPWPIIPQVFQLSLNFNTGAAFSLLRHQPQLLAVFTLLLFLALLIYGLRRHYTAWGELLAMGLILGGALGNLLDRLLLGKVTDFFDFIIIHYPVFNVADSLIFIGVFWLVVLQLKQPLMAADAQPAVTCSVHEHEA